MRHGPLFRMLIPEQRTMPQYRKKEREFSFRPPDSGRRKEQKKRKDCNKYPTTPGQKILSYFVSEI